MKITNHLLAMDFHTDILNSLSPLSRRHAADRFAAIATTLNAQIPEDVTGDTTRYANPITARINQHFGPDFINSMFAEYCREEQGMLMRAQTVFCTEEILEEILEASETLLDDIIIEQDVFIPEGLLVFEKPYRFTGSYKADENYWQFEEWDVTGILFSNYGPDRNPKNKGVLVKLYGHWRGVWFVHSQHKPQGFLSTYRDVADCGFIYNPETGATETHFSVSREHADEITLKKILEVEKAIEGRSLNHDRAKGTPTLIDNTFFLFGGKDSVDESNKGYDEEILRLKRFLLALFRMTYEYLEVEKQETPRHFTKRAVKAKRQLPQDGYLVQLKLRRKVHDYEHSGIRGRSPSYAFRVRGHWKRAYLRSRKLPVGDPAAYRHVYVKDYIKGRGTLVESRRVVRISD